MRIEETVFKFGTDYFSPLTIPFKQWTLQDKVKVASMCTLVIPIFMGLLTALGYAGKKLRGRVSEEISTETAQKTNQTFNATIQQKEEKPGPRPANQAPTPPKKSEERATNKKELPGIGTAFFAKEGVSQHSPKYHTLVDHKTNKNGTKEPVYLATAACTPLAFAFAATASKANETKSPASFETPTAILDSFVGDKTISERGVTKIKQMINQPKSQITLDTMNLGCDKGLELYNYMTRQTITFKMSFNGEQNGYYYYDSINQLGDMVGAENQDWYKTSLKSIKNGEGAVVILGGYSIGVRRVNDAFEIFDSHNSNSYTGENGACVIHCSSEKEFDACLDKIRNAGSAAAGGHVQPEAQGVEIYVI